MLARKHHWKLTRILCDAQVRKGTQEDKRMPRKRKAGREAAREPQAFKGILTRMNVEGWRALRLLAAERDTKLNALAIEAFNDLLAKHGKRRQVENPLLTDD